MESLYYTIEDGSIAELFGRQSFTTKESAIFELIKNAYDSGSRQCNISIKSTNDVNEIIIEDSGKGMDIADIKRDWMHVGNSRKGYVDEDVPDRIQTGSKGVGRFALARLGNKVEIHTKKENSKGNLIKTDWKTTTSDYIDKKKVGTQIVISELRDKWKHNDIKKLEDFVNRAYNDNKMKIDINFTLEKYDKKSKKNLTIVEDALIAPLFGNLKSGINYTQKITMYYQAESQSLECKIENDEFMEDAKQKAGDINIGGINLSIDLMNIMKKEILLNGYDQELFIGLGDFSAEFYFSLDRVLKGSKEKFLYKYEKLDERVQTGVILYRNNFSISSMEGKKDWLKLNARSRLSPAAASHKTGSWRVRANQLSGFVDIDKEENKNLVDLSNRQGLDENEYYQLFVDIISKGLVEFERYRQSIIRRIVEDDEEGETERPMLESFLKNPNIISGLDAKQSQMLINDIIAVRDESKRSKEYVEEYAERVKYDVRILNMLATQGLKANSVAHEFHNDRNLLAVGYEDIVIGLQDAHCWDQLTSIQDDSQINIPYTIDELKRVTDKLGVFLDTMLNQIRKSEFTKPVSNFEELLNIVKNRWESEYGILEIQIDYEVQGREKFLITPDVVNVIFDNLILNSIQNNHFENSLNIDIKCSLEYGVLHVVYSDSGQGLDSMFSKDPFRILEVHESSRAEGHGLGMWIINNTIQLYDGEVTDINGTNGFEIAFYLKGDKE